MTESIVLMTKCEKGRVWGHSVLAQWALFYPYSGWVITYPSWIQVFFFYIGKGNTASTFFFFLKGYWVAFVDCFVYKDMESGRQHTHLLPQQSSACSGKCYQCCHTSWPANPLCHLTAALHTCVPRRCMQATRQWGGSAISKPLAMYNILTMHTCSVSI